MLVEVVDTNGNVTGTTTVSQTDGEVSRQIAPVCNIFQRPSKEDALAAVESARTEFEKCSKLVREDQNLLADSLAAQAKARHDLRLSVYNLLLSLGVE